MKEFIPTCLNDKGQAHVAAELKRIGIDWDVEAVCSDIEQKNGFMDMRFHSDCNAVFISSDVYYYEITNNEASRAGLCNSGYGAYTYIHITPEMVQFEGMDDGE